MKTNLYDYVRQHGGSISEGGRRATIPGPGHSKHDRSLSLLLADDGRVVWNDLSGAHDFREVKAYLGLEDNARPVSQKEKDEMRERHAAEARRLDEIKLAFCRTVMEGAVPAADTPVVAYLASRGLTVPCGDVWFHPAAPRTAPYNRMADDPPPPPPHAAMICVSRDVQRRARGLHLTFLTPDGRKAFGDRSRLMLGPISGSALQTADVAPDGTLAVGEGLETCGWFSILHGVPCWPAWSTSGLRKFVVPRRVRRLLIAADHDRTSKGKNPGLEAAQALAERAQKHCKVEIHMPETPETDWADVGMGAA